MTRKYKYKKTASFVSISVFQDLSYEYTKPTYFHKFKLQAHIKNFLSLLHNIQLIVVVMSQKLGKKEKSKKF